MNDFLNKILGNLEEKREWKATEARFKQLPEEYQVVYGEIKHFIWQGGAGVMDPTNVFKRMIDLFEKGVADGKQVLEVTGDDVATFVSSLIENEKTYTDGLREKLNDNITKKLGK